MKEEWNIWNFYCKALSVGKQVGALWSSAYMMKMYPNLANKVFWIALINKEPLSINPCLQKFMGACHQRMPENVFAFFSWNILLLQNMLEEGREVYEEFFRWYPYCYGYWKKYSDLEKKSGFLDRTESVIRITPQNINSILYLPSDWWLKNAKSTYFLFVFVSFIIMCKKEKHMHRLADITKDIAFHG